MKSFFQFLQPNKKRGKCMSNRSNPNKKTNKKVKSGLHSFTIEVFRIATRSVPNSRNLTLPFISTELHLDFRWNCGHCAVFNLCFTVSTLYRSGLTPYKCCQLTVIPGIMRLKPKQHGRNSHESLKLDSETLGRNRSCARTVQNARRDVIITLCPWALWVRVSLSGQNVWHGRWFHVRWWRGLWLGTTV